ncbi:MAG: glutamine synthetase [Acidimicrobiales bacterium]|nr:glutamine synthetase [Acidimicrobiales bacterium]
MSDPLADLGGGFDTVIVAAPDIQGRLIGRRVPADTLDVVASEGVSVCTCVYGWDIAQSVDLLAGGDLPYTGMHNGMGDFLLMPDLATLRAATWLDRSAIVLADSVELDGTPTAVAPRTILRRQLDRLAERGLTASVGTELEYYLFHGTPRELHDADYRGLRPTTVRPADFSIAEGDSLEGFLADLRRRLAGADVAVEASQVEWGLGQIETTLVHCDPLAMADRHVLYKLAVRNRAAANAMTATFMAKPVDDQPGSSCHVHLSLTAADDTPVFWDVGAPGHRSDVLHHAIGGVLAHAPELMAWYAPTINSYRRTRSKDAAGWGQTWGVDHRFVSVRVVGHAPRSLRLEFRLPGADTNPYLTLAGVLASVIDGIDARTQPGPPVEGNPFDIDPDAMPQHLGAAAELFAGSDWLRSTFGTDVVDHHATLARFEWSQFLDRVTDWERRRYFDGV